MADLIIAEKPSVAGDIANFLGLRKVGRHYEGNSYICVGAVGHLCQLLPEGDRDPWGELSDLPKVMKGWQSCVYPKTQEVYDGIEKLARRPDVENIINACDDGREGELIFDLIVSKIGLRKPLLRLRLKSMTHEGMSLAFKSLGPVNQNQMASARCRSMADYVVGVNGTRGATQLKRYLEGGGDLVNVGRVRTPVLAIVYDREVAIANFKSTPFWRSKARFISNNSGKQESFEAGLLQEPPWAGETLGVTQALTESLQHPENACVIDAQDIATEKIKQPPKLFSLTSLQKLMSRKHGISAANTLALAQSLYETHKVLSYPRTDSEKLPEDYAGVCLSRIEELSSSNLIEAGLRVSFARLQETGEPVTRRPGKRVFDDAGVSDHFAIIPAAAVSQSKQALSAEESLVFHEVCTAFCRAFSGNAVIDVTTRTIRLANSAQFAVAGKVIREQGWLSVGMTDTAGEEGESEEDDEGGILPPMSGPQDLSFVELVVTEGKTKAPPFYTEATLLGAMENAGRFVEDEELSQAVGVRGLGTPATRAGIIESLLATENPNGTPKTPDLGRQGKSIRITKKGASTIRTLRGFGAVALCSPEMTGEWEMKLKTVDQGQLSAQAFMRDIEAYVGQLVRALQGKAASSQAYQAPAVHGACPACGQQHVRGSRFDYVCDCGHFKVGKTVAGKSIELAEVESLLAKGHTAMLKGFTSKAGKAFSAALKLERDNEDPKTIKVGFVFEDEDAPKYQCPQCERPLKHHQGKKAGRAYSFWGCTGFKEGCQARFLDQKGEPKF